MAPVQMNVRIEKDLKAAGDIAFEEIGYTPTEVVREVWNFAKRNRHNRRMLKNFMSTIRDPREAARESDEQSLRDAEFEAWLERGSQVVGDICEKHGIDQAVLQPMSPQGFDDLLATALVEDDDRIRRGA